MRKYHPIYLRTPKYFLEIYRNRILKVFNRLKTLNGTPFERATLYDLGTGYTMVSPIGFSLLGINKIITIDVKRLVEPELVKRALRYYRKYEKQLKLLKPVPIIPADLNTDNLDSYLKNNFNIEYYAPCDAAEHDLPAESVDYVISIQVLQFIDRDKLTLIMQNCFRLLKPGGYFYCELRYNSMDPLQRVEDYYIGLTYAPSEFKKLKHSGRNFLFSADYQKIFKDAGFEIVEINPYPISATDRKAFALIKPQINGYFKDYSDDELMQTGAKFVLRKPIV